MTQQRTIPLVVQVADDPTRRVRYRAALASAAIAGVFCVAVSVILIFSFLHEQKSNPLADKQMAALQVKLVEHPEDAPLKGQIRQIDQQLRASYFSRRAFFVHGGYLLLGGAIVLAVSVKSAYRWGVKAYVPDPLTLHQNNPFRVAAAARIAVIVGAVVIAGSLVGLAAMPRFRTVQFATLAEPKPDEAAPAAAASLPGDEEFAKSWPSFRGPGGSGLAVGEGYPTDWDGPSGRNILWKTPVPLPGHNSPIVWRDRIFFSGATAEKREVYCFDAAAGKLLWKQAVSTTGPALDLGEATSFAPNTLATDGLRVYAIFPTGDLAAFDMAGKRLWSKSLGRPDNFYGHASSLVTFRDRVIVQLDQGTTQSLGKSVLIALDGATGKDVWRTPRPIPASWSSPILAATKAGPQIITNSDPLVMAYDPESGAELWRAKCLGGEVAPSPIFAGGMVFVANDRAELAAIKTDGRGDVTATHVAWKYEDDLPDIVSPLCSGEFVFMTTTSGTLSECDAKTGKQVWLESIDGEFKASPALAGGKVYLTDTEGLTYVIEPGPKYKALGKAKLGDKVHASFAFVGGRIYVRGEKNLYCIGNK